ncbi:hypothetical protein S83_010441 [Arachis hypogaea]
MAELAERFFERGSSSTAAAAATSVLSASLASKDSGKAMTTSSTGGEKDLSASQTFTTSFNELVSCRSEERRSESPDPFPDLLASSRISSEGRTTNAASWVTWKFHNKVVNFGEIHRQKLIYIN